MSDSRLISRTRLSIDAKTPLRQLSVERAEPRAISNPPRGCSRYYNDRRESGKIAIKLRAIETGQPAGPAWAARGREEVSRAERRGGQWLPPRQLPFRWKCDGCPLFCMIKYRCKKRLGKPDPPPYPAGARERERATKRGREERDRESLSKNPCSMRAKKAKGKGGVSYYPFCLVGDDEGKARKKPRAPERAT